MTASVSFTYGLQGKDSKIREHLEAIQTLVSGVNAGTTSWDAQTVTGTLTNTGKLLTDANGNVTTPGQPAFRSTSSAITAAQTITTAATLAFDSETYDTGGDYNTTTYTFTAPVDGVYAFVANVILFHNSAGYIGEYMATSATVTNTPANDTWGDMGSLALTAGDWDVFVTCYVGRNTATWTRSDVGISTTSGNSGTGLVAGQSVSIWEFASSATTPQSNMHSIGVRASLSATTTYYAKVRANFSAGQPQYTFKMWARRVR